MLFFVVEIGEDDTFSVVVVSFTFVLAVGVVAVLGFIVEVEKNEEDLFVVFFNVVLDVVLGVVDLTLVVDVEAGRIGG